MVICNKCKHFIFPDACAHPELVDMIDGSPTQCWSNRKDPETDDPNARPLCGYMGVFYEATRAKPPAKATRGG